MNLSRRDLLGASALLLAGPGRVASADAPAAHAPGAPVVLCWNENPYGPAPAARRSIAESIAAGCRYPSDAEVAALVAALAAREQVDAQHIVIGSGSGELLCALGLIYGHDGGEIIAAAPTYGELPHYAGSHGALLRFVPVDAQLQHDLAAMHAALSARTRAVYLCNPNNPTGTALPAARLRAFIRALPARVVAIVDEAYIDFSDDPAISSVRDLVAERPVVVLRTFSKIHGMAGLRCGYAVAPPAIAAALAAARMSTPNIFAVRAARASLDEHAFLSDCRRRILATRARLTAELRRLGHRYAQPQGNFVFFDTAMPLARFAALMQQRGILVGRQFAPYDTWCRITIGTEREIGLFLENLRAVSGRA